MSDTYEITKVNNNGVEKWDLMTFVNDMFYGKTHKQFDTYYDAEAYARQHVHGLAYSSEPVRLYDEYGNPVYRRAQARFDIIVPDVNQWNYYYKCLRENAKLEAFQKKWYFKFVNFFAKKTMYEVTHPQFLVYDFKLEMHVAAFDHLADAENYVRTAYRKQEHYGFDVNMQLNREGDNNDIDYNSYRDNIADN